MESKCRKESFYLMYCWNCGTRNSEDNSFCGKCGKRIAKAAGGDSQESRRNEVEAPSAPPAAGPVDPAPLPSNPLVEEPRIVRDSPRTLAQMEIGPPSNVAVEEPPSRPAAEQNKREPLIMSRTSLPPNRITGPSFLGLSDEPSFSAHDSSYLLEEDEPRKSSWRAWVAVAVLAIFGFLIYKQWNAIRDGAAAVAAQATGNGDQPSEHQKPSPQPPAAVSSASETQPTTDAMTGSSQTEMAQNTSPASAAEQQQNSVDKPEHDRATSSSEADKQASNSAPDDKVASESTSSSQASDSAEAPTASDESAAADSAPDIPTEEPATAKAPAKAETKRATPSTATEPHFNNAPVDQAERYLSGRGVAQDCSRAISLLRSSAREGNPRAQVKLGALYATGQCVTQDRAAAYQWLLRAHETQPNNSYLQRTMNSLWTNMTPEERDRITR
jgi:hypothetical protein